jgi:hypothetical protein
MGSTMGSNEDFRLMLAAVSASRMRPVVDSVYPLKQAREATLRMEAGGQFGKIVLTPGGKSAESSGPRSSFEFQGHELEARKKRDSIEVD